MPPSVVVVDDEPELADAFAELLRDEGHEVTTFTDAVAAVTALESGAMVADLVLTDVAMPRLDGLQLCLRLRESRPDVPVVIITGDSKVDTSVAALRAGAYDYLCKPVRA